MPVALPASSPWFAPETSALLRTGVHSLELEELNCLGWTRKSFGRGDPFQNSERIFPGAALLEIAIRFYTTTIVRQCVLNRFAWGLATIYTGLHEAVSHKYHSWLTQKLVVLTPLVVGVGVARSPPLMEKSENDLIFSLLFSLRNLVSLERFMY